MTVLPNSTCARIKLSQIERKGMAPTGAPPRPFRQDGSRHRGDGTGRAIWHLEAQGLHGESEMYVTQITLVHSVGEQLSTRLPGLLETAPAVNDGVSSSEGESTRRLILLALW